MKKRILSIVTAVLMVLCLTPTFSSAAANVAEVNGVQYPTLQEAVNKAPANSTVTLLTSTTENLVMNSSITVNGNGKTINGKTTVNNGTLKNVTLKPAPTDSNGFVLSVGSQSENKITLEGVTVNYSVTNRNGASASTLSGNNSDITINNCRFINEANNGTSIENVNQWSYGLSIGGQSAKGKITFTNNEFNGAFRTMLPSLNGNVLIENCKFTNSVYSVANGPTTGSQAEATSLTTARKNANRNDNIIIKNNTFDNAGAIFAQTMITTSNNIFKFDKFEHFIQAGGVVGEPIDFSNNTFVMGNNNIVAVDVAVAPVILPENVVAVDFWVWSDTPADKRPADYRDYKYTYKKSGNEMKIVYMPQSDIALDQFICSAAKGNKQISNGDTLRIEKNLKLPTLNIEKGTKLTIDIAANATLEVSDSLKVAGETDVVGTGFMLIPKNKTIEVPEGGVLTVANSVNLTNEGSLLNDGNLTIPDDVNGDGTIAGSGNTTISHEAIHYPAVNPTCDKAGNIEYWYCKTCNKYYSDSALTSEITKESTVLKALGHKYKDGKCTVCGKVATAQKPAGDKSPSTGDATNTAMIFSLIILSLLAAGGVKFCLKK